MQIGEKLRNARQEKGYSFEYLEETTKIRAKYLEALENERFDILPGQVYAKAFLRTYAKYLGLDVDEIMAEFKEENKEEPIEVSAPEPKPEIKDNSKKWHYVVAAVAIVALFAFKSLYGVGNQSEDKSAVPPTSQQQTAQQKSSPPSPKQEAQTETSKPADGVRVVLKVTDNQSWMQVVADGNTVFTGLVNPGEMKDFKAQEKILLHVGNAGAVEVNVNGKDLGRLGKNGQVVQIPFAAGEVPQLTQG